MKIEIVSITPREIKDTVEMLIRFGGKRETSYGVSSFKGSSYIEEELFMALSELGIRNLCNSGYYHIVVGKIVDKYLKKDEDFRFPIDLDKFECGLKRPGFWERISMRIWRVSKGLHPLQDNTHDYSKI